MFSLSPKEDKFYDMFIENSQMIYEASSKFDEFMNDFSEPISSLKNIKEIERQCDNQQHKIINELNKTFITPFDREDIFIISKKMDDIVDIIEESANSFVMFNVDKIKDEAKVLVKLIVEACENILTLMAEFKNMKNNIKLRKIIIEINKIEEEGDVIFRKAVRDLFVQDMPVLDVIKWREIYQYIENALDACEAVANIIEGVAMKNA
jgi:predicted phosphate transport protein (TIGR00153 family)